MLGAWGCECVASAPMTSEFPVRAVDLHRSFRVGSRRIEVLRGIDLAVAPGECLFLCGASGAGKSTLLYSLAGMDKPDRGQVFFHDISLYESPESKRAQLRNSRMGFVFQSYFLLNELTALENVMLPGMIGRRPARAQAEQYLERVGLADRMHHLPAEMSGGEQQRVAIARALFNDPEVLFADEPTGNLDSRTGGVIVDLLLALVREKQKTLVVVTHDMRLAARGDRTIVIRDGGIAD